MKRFALIAALLLTGSVAFVPEAAAQSTGTFTPAPVTISTDMVRVGDHIFYAHVVLARQTLYSIGKAYGVSSLDIIDSNPKLDLRNRPIHPGDVLLIPVRVRLAEPVDTPSAPVDTLAAPVDSTAAAVDSPTSPVDTLTVPADTLAAVVDTVAVPEPVVRPPFVYEYVDKVHVALLLPLAADSGANAYYMNFYFGALLAARDLAESDIDLDITVIDVNSAKDYAKAPKVLAQSDVIIGPVSTKDITRTLAILPKDKFIVSPMDPKTEALTADNRVILAATPAKTQIDDAIAWMESNMGPADSLIIVRERGVELGENPAYLVNKLDSVDSHNKVRVSYTLSEGIKMNEDFFVHHTHLKDTVTWVVAASDHDVFVKDVIRNVALQNYLGHNTYIYGPAKAKSPDMDEMCGARLHQSATYHIDYDDPAVIRFVRDYRALFQTEPDNFAFHGYDTMTYFVTACDDFGRNWQQKLDEHRHRGLQTNFKFYWTPDTVGDVNAGIRRVVYSPGFKVEVLK